MSELADQPNNPPPDDRPAVPPPPEIVALPAVPQVEGLPPGKSSTRPLFGQRLKTPIYEEGVKLDPDFSTDREIGNRIGRVWATLWGWTGSALRMLRVDYRGWLLTASHSDIVMLRQEGNGAFDPASEMPGSDLGEYYDELRVWSINCVFDLEHWDYGQQNSTRTPCKVYRVGFTAVSLYSVIILKRKVQRFAMIPIHWEGTGHWFRWQAIKYQ